MIRNANPEVAYGIGIEGYAVYMDGTAADNAAVELLYDDGSVKEKVTTDETGKYHFTYAEVGKYTVRVTDVNGNTAVESLAVKRMNVFEVFLVGETELVLKKGYTVSGTVLPVGESKVTLADADGTVIVAVDTADGTFRMENVPNGTYVLKAENRSGSVTTEITIFNADISTIELTIASSSAASVTGLVEVENRDNTRTKKEWVQITVYNSDGLAVAQGKTDSDGTYRFENLSSGNYSIVAETTELRSDKKKKFDRTVKLTGYAYISVTEPREYIADTIILYEESDGLASIAGKVTAQGETQDCEVILSNVFRHEIARYTTGKNGKYSFKNIPDGLYFITAVTQSDGMGFASVTVQGGKVYGSTEIKVLKTDKIVAHEEAMARIPVCETADQALVYKEAVATEKAFYDALPQKEKKQFSRGYIERLNRLCELITNCAYNTPEGVIAANGGMAISSEELASEKQTKFVLTVTETAGCQIGEDGITNSEEFIQQSIEDTVGEQTLIKYYDIALSKDGKAVSNISKHTDTTGRLRITMEIPQEYRGHKNYSFVHVHNGMTTLLVDLDDNPNTVTFEVDKFSTFALAYSDTELTEDVSGDAEDEFAAHIIYDAVSGKIKVSSAEDGILYISTFAADRLLKTVSCYIPAGTVEREFEFDASQEAVIWNSNQQPLCEKFMLTSDR